VRSFRFSGGLRFSFGSRSSSGLSVFIWDFGSSMVPLDQFCVGGRQAFQFVRLELSCPFSAVRFRNWVFCSFCVWLCTLLCFGMAPRSAIRWSASGFALLSHRIVFFYKYASSAAINACSRSCGFRAPTRFEIQDLLKLFPKSLLKSQC